MAGFKVVSSQIDFPSLEAELLKYWKDNKIFEKSIESRPEEKKWNFLDGPPFVTGSPHYGSLLSSIPKDVFGRYYTMKGYRVRRVWGWDGHGLPIENKVENKLGIKRKKDIEETVGVEKFIEECLHYVNDVSADWEWYIDHIGRWVDFKNAYKTWDMDYMESVMWVFKQMYDKGYIYKGLRVSLYCPHCATPISNFEVAMDADNYKDVTENSNTYKYKLKGEDKTYLLAWSTTPWNKIVTPALAVNPKLDYVRVKQGDEYYILAKTTLKMLHEEPGYEIVEEFKGSELLDKEFEGHYDFYKIEEGKRAFVVVGGDFVTADEGTGIVTIAAYGEEDLAVMNKENIQIFLHVDDEGMILESVPLFGGKYYLKTNEMVNQDLKERGLVYDEKSITHSVAHCWRCGTRLFYAPKDAWFVNVAELKEKLFKNNKEVNWYPKHFKEGRFAKSMEAAPDWNISRNRYWGSPVPVWECTCGERFVPGSVKELEERSGQKVENLHKPFIDDVHIKCSKCDKDVKRVPEVLDSWIEAGSASFAERHFPFNESEKLEDFFPPDFVAEYTGQIRAWFYVLHVIATALYDSPAFKNVLVSGVLLGTDGRKMSKNFGNFPDPKEVMQKYGGDAVRVYLLSSAVMKGEDANFASDGVPNVVKGFLLILWNSYKFFTDYANNSGWACELTPPDIRERLTVLDRWILARLTEVVLINNKAMDGYDASTSLREIENFVVNDLSTWYIRRSRDRVGPGSDPADETVFLSVTYGVLVTLSKLLAPLTPFIAEELFRNLTNEESVHLQDYPAGDKNLLDEQLIKDMVTVRKLVEMGHSQRKEASLKLRQPLAKFIYSAEAELSKELETVLAEELNVKAVEFTKKGELSGKIDTQLTPELEEEGKARDLIREIQIIRKGNGMTLEQKAHVKSPFIPTNPKLIEMVKTQTNALSLEHGETLDLTTAE